MKRRNRKVENEGCLWEIGLDLSHVLVTIGVIDCLPFFHNINMMRYFCPLLFSLSMFYYYSIYAGCVFRSIWGERRHTKYIGQKYPGPGVFSFLFLFLFLISHFLFLLFYHLVSLFYYSIFF